MNSASLIIRNASRDT